MTVKVASIIGARPQFIKAAAVSREMFAHKGVKEVIVHTGQHFDRNMSQIFFEEMRIPKPSYDLGINDMSHGAMTGRMLEKVEEVLIKEKPDVVLVYGDTNTTLAGALAAAKIHIPVAHVEAGLRSFNMKMPEEINRIVADRLSSVLFCPTERAVENLKREGFEGFDCRIVRSGDVMQDAALYYSEMASARSTIIKGLGLTEFILCTIHRAENTDDPRNLKSIMSGLEKVDKETKVVLPLHPRTRKFLAKANIGTTVKIIDPVGYFDIIELIKNCSLVMTDSGGLQKEAFFFKKHCVTLRNETEWVELVDGGYNLLSALTPDGIYASYRKMMNKRSDFNADLYGKGRAAQRIVSELSHLKE